MAECPNCGDADPIKYDGLLGEPTIIECPECGWNAKVVK